MNEQECDHINLAINDIPMLREGFYLSSFLIQPHIFHVTIPREESRGGEHSHPTFELSLVLEGKIGYRVGDCEFTLDPGDMIMIPPGQKHQWKLYGLHTVVFGYMCFISGKGIHPLRQNGLFLDAVKDRRFHIRRFLQFQECILRIIDLLGRSAVFQEDEARSFQILSYIHLFRLLLPNWRDDEKPSKRSGTVDGGKQLIEQIKFYIYDNLSRPIHLAELRTRFGLSKDHLNRLFKKSEGVPIGQFVIAHKIERASKMLETGDCDIKSIAFQCGFADLNYFCSAFRRITGMPPTQYRRHVRNS